MWLPRWVRHLLGIRSPSEDMRKLLSSFTDGIKTGIEDPELRERMLYSKIREEVIEAGPFTSLASAAAFEMSLRAAHGLSTNHYELDFPLWPHRQSIYWAVEESARPRSASFG